MKTKQRTVVLMAWLIVFPLISWGITHADTVETKHTVIVGHQADVDAFLNTYDVDSLFEFAQTTMEMWPAMGKVRFWLYHNRNQSDTVRAGYIYRNNTIYLCIEDARDGVIVHELAHAVSAHQYGGHRPDGEILSRGVESRLNPRPHKRRLVWNVD